MQQPVVTLQDLAHGQQKLFAAFAVMAQEITMLKAGQDKLAIDQNELSAKFDSGFGGISKELRALRQYTEFGFDTMNDRFDHIERRVDRIELHLKKSAHQA